MSSRKCGYLKNRQLGGDPNTAVRLACLWTKLGNLIKMMTNLSGHFSKNQVEPPHGIVNDVCDVTPQAFFLKKRVSVTSDGICVGSERTFPSVSLTGGQQEVRSQLLTFKIPRMDTLRTLDKKASYQVSTFVRDKGFDVG